MPALGLTVVAAASLAVAWLWPLPDLAHDLLSAHMAQHLVAMNGGALFLALAWPRPFTVRAQRGGASIGLAVATALQFGLLMIWHLPGLLAEAHHNRLLHVLMQATIFGAAFLFWRQMFAVGSPLWLRIVCLLATAKLFCLAGAVLIFSRRAIYGPFGDPAAWNMSALEDQHLAGLLMVSACAIIYVAVATGLFASWLLRDRGSPSGYDGPVALPR